MIRPVNKYITEEEKAIFHQEISKLRSAPAMPVSPPAPSDLSGNLHPTLPTFQTTGPVPLLSGGDPVVYKANGVRDKELKRLGKIASAIEISLDLHGYTLTQAKDRLGEFLLMAFDRGASIVHIIHGKNKQGETAVLKSRVVSWLKQVPWVLALRSARQQDGGTGALYVLLRTR